MKRKKDPLAEEAWRALIHHIKADPSRAGAIKRIFEQMDTDGSGGLDILELMKGLTLLGLELTPEHVAAFAADLDENNDGQVCVKCCVHLSS